MKRRKKKGTGTGVIVFVVLCIFGVVAFGKMRLENKKEELAIKAENLEKQINGEKERAKEIEDWKAYVQTKKYIEKIAREQLGLVYKDEIILKEDDK